jgi:hypothetical protein
MQMLVAQVAQVVEVALVQLQLDLMVETEFHFQVELFPELMAEVAVVGTVALPVVLVVEEHRYQVAAMQVLAQTEQMELMEPQILAAAVVLRNGAGLA